MNPPSINSEAALDSIGLQWGFLAANSSAPEDVAEMVRFLVSDAAAYVTGQRVYLDGGAAL